MNHYIARDEVLALTTSAHQQRVYRGLVDLKKLEPLLKTLPLALHGIPPHLANRFLSNVQARLNTLYQLLFAPLSEQAQEFRRLIFVPHGPLHYLPFQAFWNSQTRRYLVEDFEISYLPAASQLSIYRQRAAELRRETQAASLVLGYSGNGETALPYVLEETRAIADCLGQDVTLYLEEQARLETLQNLSQVYRVIHLATHGEFRADAPLFSYVDLADGKLLTVDLFNLKLRAGIITLSACESGLNVITGGDELVGLSRACLYAGAASLLLSLWKVEDYSTAGLMREFYQRLALPGTTRAGALRQAQLTLLHGDSGTNDYRHPYFWAAFCLIGEPGEL